MSIADSPYQIFSLERKDFLKTALAVFRFQAQHCSIYKDYIEQLGIDVIQVQQLEAIPFLPIQFFKTHRVISKWQEEYLLFESSATTSQVSSKHFVADQRLYDRSLLASFEAALGNVNDKVVLGLLPHYLERKNSSLVYMVDYLIGKSGRAESGFYLDKQEDLFEQIIRLETQKQDVVLFGVTFALLDFAKKFSSELKYTRIIETGGMKGRGEELTREAVHKILNESFGPRAIYSEYGMAELLSQSYYMQDKRFEPPAWKSVLVRDLYDPFDLRPIGKGALNIIDLANIYSCSFIATDDIGCVYEDGKFDVLGRLDASEIRGCNLLLND